MEVRMDLARIIIREDDDQQIIILSERDGDRQFPIVIGINEGLAIDRRVKGIVTPRPMTHDLMASIIDELECELEKIVMEIGGSTADEREMRQRVLAIFGMVNWIYQWHRPGGRLTEEELADAFTDLLLRGVLEKRPAQ